VSLVIRWLATAWAIPKQEYPVAHCSCCCYLPQEQVKGYTALTQQLAADYNIHGAAVMGHAAGQQASAGAGAGSSRRQAGASSSAAAAAAAGGQPGGQAEGDMSDEENQRHRDNAGGGPGTATHAGCVLILLARRSVCCGRPRSLCAQPCRPAS
jgi:hypothetical protein